jgi:transcriptional regulator with XRE-family HTH domain
LSAIQSGATGINFVACEDERHNMSITGKRVRALREAKAWSQAHLAQASCVNIRTIQRLEAGESAAPETLLAIASALEVTVQQLNGRHVDGTDIASALGTENWIESPTAHTIAALLAIPCLIFVALNVLKFGLGWGAPYDSFASLGGRFMSFDTFNKVSPFVFLGGAGLAIAMSVASQMQPRWTLENKILSIRGVDLRPNLAATLIMVLATAGAGALVAYAFAEQIAELRLG